MEVAPHRNLHAFSKLREARWEWMEFFSKILQVYDLRAGHFWQPWSRARTVREIVKSWFAAERQTRSPTPRDAGRILMSARPLPARVRPARAAAHAPSIGPHRAALGGPHDAAIEPPSLIWLGALGASYSGIPSLAARNVIRNLKAPLHILF